MHIKKLFPTIACIYSYTLNQLDKKAPSHEGTKQPYDILKDELLSYIRSYIQI